MDPFGIFIVGLASAAGILVATLTTIICAVRHACERRDRQLFRDYVEYPQKVEAWLVYGAVEQIKRSLPISPTPR